MSCFRKRLLSLIAALAVTCGAVAADAGKPTAPTPAVSSSSDLQKLMQQFSARRDAILANRDALLTQLKNATAEQKKAILEKMAADEKELMDAQRAMAKQMRDELRKLRTVTPPGGHR